MVFVLTANRITRELLRKNRLQVFLETVLQIEADHIRARRHNLAHVERREVKDVIHEAGLGIIDEALLMTFLHEQADFLLGVRVLARADRDAEPMRDPVCHMVEQPDKGIHQPVKNQYGQRHVQHDFLHVVDGHRLWRELTEDNMPARDDGKGHGQRQRMPELVAEAQPLRHRQDEPRHKGLANPAEAQ